MTIDSVCGCVETDLPQLIADERSQTYATVPGMTDLSWSLLPPDLGCEIVGTVTNGLGEVQGVIIRAGAEAGKITIQAADGPCLYRGELALVCPVDGEEGCSGGNCKDFGGGNLQNRNGPALDFGLGGDSPTTSGGILHLLGTIPGTNLTALSTLRLLHPGPNTRAVWDKGGWLRQVRTPLGLVDLVPVSTNNGVLMAYDLRFYRHSPVSTNLEGGFYGLLSGQTPEVTWQISNPDSSGATTHRLRIVEVRGSLNRTHDFKWLSATGRWKQTDGATAREVYGLVGKVQGLKYQAAAQGVRRFQHDPIAFILCRTGWAGDARLRAHGQPGTCWRARRNRI